jgi:hypothetical protein
VTEPETRATKEQRQISTLPSTPQPPSTEATAEPAAGQQPKTTPGQDQTSANRQQFETTDKPFANTNLKVTLTYTI